MHDKINQVIMFLLFSMAIVALLFGNVLIIGVTIYMIFRSPLLGAMFSFLVIGLVLFEAMGVNMVIEDIKDPREFRTYPDTIDDNVREMFKDES